MSLSKYKKWIASQLVFFRKIFFRWKLFSNPCKIFTIFITDIDFEFSRHPTSEYAIAGLPTTLPCAPPTSYPPANVTWYKNNQPLTNQFTEDRKSVFIVDPANGIWDLFIADVQRVHEGEYFCVAENAFAVPTSRTSKVATLRVGGEKHCYSDIHVYDINSYTSRDE
jgi:hypothetical protein